MNRQSRNIKVQVLKEMLEAGKKSPYGCDCGSAMACIVGVFREDWPELAEVIEELHKFGRETERKRGWI